MLRKETIFMINTFFIEGTLQEMSELKETDKGIHYAHILLKVERPFRNSDGNYDSDFVEIELWRGTSEVIFENFKKDMLLGIQGRIQSKMFSSTNGKPNIVYKLVAEKISILDLKLGDK